MHFISMIENKEFKQFIDGFYSIYNNAKEGKEAIELESDLWKALKKLFQLLMEEIEMIAKKMDNQLEITEQDKTYITFLKSNPLIFDCTLHHNIGTTLGCAAYKKGQSVKDLEPKLLWLRLLNNIFSTAAEQFKRAFIVFPEFAQDPSLLFACIHFPKFTSVYRHFQILNLKLPTGFGQTDTQWFEALYRFFLKSGGTLTPPNNCADPSTWYKQLKEYVCKTKIFSIATERKLLLEIIREIAESARQNHDQGASNALSENLFFLLQQGYTLKDTDNPEDQWFRLVPWESLKDPHLFLFDYIEQEKENILEYWKNHHPNLVLGHLLKGNFFIATLLIEFGLKEPEINPVQFLTESVHIGLKASKEVKKFHAYLLLQFSLGLVDQNALLLLKDLLQTENYEQIQKIVYTNISRMVEHYLNSHYEGIIVNKSTFKDINKVMMALNKDYAIALSAIYGIPIHGCSQTSKLYRGVTIPKTSFNLSLAQHWINFGHRATYYSMWGHGYNRGVSEDLEEGPTMTWMGNSDTTRTATILATNYVHYHDDDSDAFLLSMKYRPGEPIFFGNLCPSPKKIPLEIELPMCFAQNIEGVYHPDRSGTIVDAFYQEEIAYLEDTAPEKAAEVTLLKGESLESFSDRTTAIALRHKDNLAKDLEDKPLQFEREFSDYLKKYDSHKMLSGFENDLAAFGSFKERMNAIRQTFIDLTPLGGGDIVSNILGYAMHQKVLPLLNEPKTNASLSLMFSHRVL